jgi:solute:Na+ symporter, SSS family
LFFLTGKNPEILQATPIHKGLFHADFTLFDLIILFLTYSTTFIVGPDIYSRIFCAGSERTAFRSVLVVGVILLPVAFILTYLGIHTPLSGAAGDISGLLISWQNMFPGWVTGLLLAALLSAMMSSADTTLLTASMIVSELLSGPLSGKKSLVLTKIFIVGSGILSLIISLYITSVIDSLLLALSIFSGAFFVPVLAGLTGLTPRANRILPAIITGGMLALGGKLIGMYFHELTGNILIVFSFIANAGILFLPLRGFHYASR